MAVGTPGALPKVTAAASFLGQGVAYPLQFDPVTGRLKLSVGNQCVQDAMVSIFSTQPGERAMQPDYGCDVGTFEPGVAPKIEARAQENVTSHEPRVAAVRVDLNDLPNSNEVNLAVSFDLAGQAGPQTLTFPVFIPLAPF